MPYETKESPEAIELSVSAPNREELFRTALAAVLETAYGPGPADGTYAGHVVPVQAAGEGDDVLLAGLVDDTLRAIAEEPGTLRAPRWLAFDESRVTATLPVHTPRTASRRLEIARAEVGSGGEGPTAVLELLLPAGD